MPYDFELCCSWYPFKLSLPSPSYQSGKHIVSQEFFSLISQMVFCGKPSLGKWLVPTSQYGTLTPTVQLVARVDSVGSSVT